MTGFSRRAVENSYFEEVLLMNSIRINRNLLKKFVFAHFVLLEDYEQGALRKETVMVTFIEWFIIAIIWENLTDKFHYYLEQFT